MTFHLTPSPCNSTPSSSTTSSTPSYGSPQHGSPTQSSFPTYDGPGDDDGHPVAESRVLIVMTGILTLTAFIFFPFLPDKISANFTLSIKRRDNMYAYGKRRLRSRKFMFPFFLAVQSEILPVMASRHDIGNTNLKFANDLPLNNWCSSMNPVEHMPLDGLGWACEAENS